MMLELEKLSTQPIPEIRSPVGWKNVAIVECGKPLIALSILQNTRIIIEPEYFRRGVPHAIEEIYVREGVARRLAHAASLLPEQYSLLVWDAWRSLAVQRALFDEECRVLREQFPSLAEDEVRRRSEVYVSLPSDDVRRPSPHYTGGAVDLTIAGPNRRPLPMGTGFDAFNEHSRTRVLEERIEKDEMLSEEEKEWLQNRRILYHTMVACGFTSYCEEWWHFDYGDQFWGVVTSTQALYGGIEPSRSSPSF